MQQSIRKEPHKKIIDTYWLAYFVLLLYKIHGEKINILISAIKIYRNLKKNATISL